MKEQKYDPINHPSHYTSDPSGVECIEINGGMPEKKNWSDFIEKFKVILK